ncbi:MAG: hypothetical protein RH947_11370 [Alcanivorax sp.]|jgi:hypothetical protein
MDWEWCGLNLDCITNWFLNTQAAGWAQAIGTVLAILASGWLANRGFRREIALRRQEFAREKADTILSAKAALAAISGTLVGFPVGGALDPEHLRALSERISKFEGYLLTLAFGRNHDPGLAKLFIECGNCAHAAAWYMKVVASGRDADFSVIQQFFGAMAKGQSLLQRFSEAFANDQSLHFHDVIDPEEATIQPTSVETGSD